MASNEELKAMGIKSDNVIICENCYEENEATRTTCKNCGAKLYRGGLGGKVQSRATEQKNDYSGNYYKKDNTVALAIKIISIVASVIGVIASLTLFGSSYTEDLAIIYLIVSIVGGIFSYALGEIIQKLQNIEDNTK